ncbi:MAG: polysaccharide biosynthesis C-terminal domain-containing protein [Anaeromassilibacillus sp.]
MVMPILLFPSSFLTSLSPLLIPGWQRPMRAANAKPSNAPLRGHSAHPAFLLSHHLASDRLCGGPRESLLWEPAGGRFPSHHAPIIPLMYVDSIVDGMLKGLDQQAYSFRYNFMDSIMRVVLIAVLLPVFGVKAYIFILFLSEIFNASLSISRLL